MNIYDYAMQMEKDGEKYYLEQIPKTKNIGLTSILKILADSEIIHFNTIKKLKEQSETSNLLESNILTDAKNIFTEMRDKKQDFNLDANEIEFYKEAKKIEETTYKFYLEKTQEVEDENHKKIFTELAEEEKRHVVLIENIIEFISRPTNWIENAEFNHLENY